MPRLQQLLHRQILLSQDAAVQNILGLFEGEVLEGEEDAEGEERQGDVWWRWEVRKVQGVQQEEPQLLAEVAHLLQPGSKKRFVF